MIKHPLYINAVGSYLGQVDEIDPGKLPDLKALVKEATQQSVRRITRFVQLALIGAGRCAQGQTIHSSTGVYFASCRGDTGVTVELLNDLVRDKYPPSPLTFVNSVSNAACFQVSKALGLYGKSNFVTNRYDPMYATLKLAIMDLLHSDMGAALVGSVDVCSLPLPGHRQRLHVAPEQTLAEASHWLLLSRESTPDSMATVEAVRSFADKAALVSWLTMHPLTANDVLGVGQHLPLTVAEELLTASGAGTLLDYTRNQPYYDSPTGQGIIEFIGQCQAPRLLHINSDPSGRYTLLLINRVDRSA